MKFIRYQVCTFIGLLSITSSIILNAKPVHADIWNTIEDWVKPVIDPITKPILGRCGIPGEATIYVKNNLGSKVYVLVEKSSLGNKEQELAPGQGFSSPICNREGFTVKIFTPQNCGKTFLGQSRFTRVYNTEYATITSRGIKFSTGDVLDIAGRGAGFALTYIAQGYGVPPEALAVMGVNEASVMSICKNGGSIACAAAIYKWLPSDLLSTIKSDRCLSTAFTTDFNNLCESKRCLNSAL